MLREVRGPESALESTPGMSRPNSQQAPMQPKPKGHRGFRNDFGKEFLHVLAVISQQVVHPGHLWKIGVAKPTSLQGAPHEPAYTRGEGLSFGFELRSESMLTE